MARPAPISWMVTGIGILIFIVLVPPIRRSIGQAIGWTARGFVSIAQPGHASWTTIQRSTTDRVQQLENQVRLLSRRLAAQELAASQAATERKIEEFVAAKRFPAVTAHVIAYSPDPGVQSLVIDQGQRDGIRTGQAVITDDGVLIGKVYSARDTTAVVLLLTDPNSAVTAKINNAKRSPGIVQGERGLAARMELIPKNDQVEPGQTIVTSGSEALIPPDILIGIVAEPSTRLGELFQNTVVQLPTQFTGVQVVGVVTP